NDAAELVSEGPDGLRVVPPARDPRPRAVQEQHWPAIRIAEVTESETAPTDICELDVNVVHQYSRIEGPVRDSEPVRDILAAVRAALVPNSRSAEHPVLLGVRGGQWHRDVLQIRPLRLHAEEHLDHADKRDHTGTHEQRDGHRSSVPGLDEIVEQQRATDPS